MNGRHVHGGPGCRELLGQLSDYLDDALDLSACQNFEGHMEDCPPCQAFLESLRRTVDHVKSMPTAKLPDDLKRELVEAYRRSRR